MAKRSKTNKKWFIKVRGSYLPQKGMGWLTYIPYLAYLFGTLAAVIHQQYTLTTSILLLVPNWVAAAVVMNWVAANHS